jgi:bacterial translation initiation factor 2 (bIF-2)
MKKRIYELSKELGIESKDLLKILSDLGVNAKSALNVIDEEVEEIIKELVTGKSKKENPPTTSEHVQVKEEIKKDQELIESKSQKTEDNEQKLSRKERSYNTREYEGKRCS